MKLISRAQAVERALAGVSRLGVESVPLALAAGRVLAERLVARSPLPPADHSAMDGYAVSCSTLDGDGPWRLEVRGESRAGTPWTSEVGATACRVFTGAHIPPGADAVVIQEDVTRQGDAITVPAEERPAVGQHIRPAGSDLAAGAVALEEGLRLTPGRLGLLASLDRPSVLVATRPRLTLASTGDELRPPGSAGRPGSIPESNSYVLGAIARRSGAEVRVLPFVADEPTTTAEALRQAAAACDLLVTIGGASVGDHDLVRPALEGLGAAIDFSGVAIKPGKPVATARLGNSKVLCLPGNPASATLTFLLFGVPLLGALQGLGDPLPRRVPVVVRGSHRRRPGREEYLRARLEVYQDRLAAALTDQGQSSGAVVGFAEAEALVIVPPDRERVEAGDVLEALLLSELW